MTTQLDAIIDSFERSLDDAQFTRREKQEIQAMITGAGLQKRDLAFLRSRIFAIAKERGTDENLNTIIDWLEIANKTLLPPKEKKEADTTECWFSPGPQCAAAITKLLREARHTLRICVFTISDDGIAKEILAAHRRGVTVEVISDNDKMNDLGSDVAKLAKAGIAVRIDHTPNHMHHKFAVRDAEELLTGSFNWTRSASQYNNENIIVTTNKKAVRDYENHFKKLWPQMKPFTS